MNISKFDYNLDKSFIATEPADPRDSSKLLVLNRQTGGISHHIFHDLANILTANDVLVFNETKVIPARIIGEKPSGGKVEVLLLRNLKNNIWECLTKNLNNSTKIIFSENIFACVINSGQKIKIIEFNVSNDELNKLLETDGQMPIPPYIEKLRPHKIDSKAALDLKMAYNTIYARESGSVAAPTAGLHFTDSLLKKLSDRGVQFANLTLHVGMGTFEPVQTEDLTKHKIHSEYFEISERVAQYLNEQKRSGKRIIAVGTTTTRVLETLANKNGELNLEKLSGDTSLFVYPPYKFNFIDGMITNFHLPKSTLLSLVSAFVSNPNTSFEFSDFDSSNLGKAYSEAIKHNYRFYSFGDSMLII